MGGRFRKVSGKYLGTSGRGSEGGRGRALPEPLAMLLHDERATSAALNCGRLRILFRSPRCQILRVIHPEPGRNYDKDGADAAGGSAVRPEGFVCCGEKKGEIPVENYRDGGKDFKSGSQAFRSVRIKRRLLSSSLAMLWLALLRTVVTSAYLSGCSVKIHVFSLWSLPVGRIRK